MGQPRVGEKDEDPRLTELCAAVSRLRRELAQLSVEFTDRGIAEEELAGLALMAASGVPEISCLRRSLLLIVGSIGSVSALAPALMLVRDAVDLFGDVPREVRQATS